MSESFWPELLVQELRHIVRTKKFDFDASSADLEAWWLSDAALQTAKDRGMSISADRSAGISITPETCRHAFARDYSNAPYQKKKVDISANSADPQKSSPNENKLNNMNNVNRSANLDMDMIDEDTASAFQNLDDVEASVVIPMDGLALDSGASATLVGKSKGGFTDDGPEESYEELMERLEAQQAENYKRKEAVFANVARILHTYTDETGKELTDEQSSAAGKQLANSMGMSGALSTPADQEVARAYYEGINQRKQQKKSREELQREMAEKKELEAQREALRRRFDADSVDAQGDAYEFEQLKEVEEEDNLSPARNISITTASGITISNEKVMELLKQKAADETEQVTGQIARASGAAAKGARGSAAPDLAFGFINTPEFDELLTSLEAEHELSAPPKADEEESDLAEVLRMLDEAASSNDRAGEYDPGPNFPQPDVAPKPKVMLKAGMGIAADPRPRADALEPTPIPAPEPVAAKAVVNKAKAAPSAPRGRMAQASKASAANDAEASFSDSGDSDESDDDAWKNRRKTLKNRAEGNKPDDEAAAAAVNSGVYGFGGARTTPLKVAKAMAPKPVVMKVSVERASDRVVASEEAKESDRPAGTTPARAGGGEMESPALSPGAEDTWSDVPSPPNPNRSAQAPVMKAAAMPPAPPMQADFEEEEVAAPILPLPPKAESSGLLSGSGSKGRARKPKGGKLLNIKAKE